MSSPYARHGSVELSSEALDALLVAAMDNWTGVRWRGHALWQNLIDLNVLSEHILGTRPELVIETGTFRGGSAIFLADMMRLSGVPPNVVSIDVAPEATPEHPGVLYLAGRSSVDPATAAEVHSMASGRRTFVLLDSEHGAAHVYEELRLYAPLLAVGDHLLVQDGNMHTTFGMSRDETPIGGIERFLAERIDYESDPGKSPFPTTSHPRGWIRRRAAEGA